MNEPSVEIPLKPMKGHFKEKAIEAFAGATVLDAGGREGKYSAHCLGLGKKVTLCDIEIAPGSGDGYEVVRGDIQSLPFPDDSFDTVICFDVLEHVDDDAAALAEACRVARQNVLISVPRVDGNTRSSSGLIFRHYRDQTHRRYYTEESFGSLLASAPGGEYGICPFGRVRPAKYYGDAGGPRFLSRMADGILWFLTWRRENLLRNYFGIIRLTPGTGK